MKRILCAALALVMCAGVAVAASGCGCEKSKDKNGKKTTTSTASGEPGYKVEPTNPDFTDGNFGYYRLSDKEVMLTQYNGDEKEIKVPESVKGAKVSVIGANVFQNKKLESVTIPKTITEIQKYAFSSCQNLKEVVLPEGVKVVGTNAFWNCRNLTKLTLPKTLKELGWNAFSATGITSVVIPESNTLSALKEKVFYQCFDLKEVTIPITITNIADDTFAECAEGMTIKAYTGSYAVSYAKSHNIKLEEMKRKK